LTDGMFRDLPSRWRLGRHSEVCARARLPDCVLRRCKILVTHSVPRSPRLSLVTPWQPARSAQEAKSYTDISDGPSRQTSTPRPSLVQVQAATVLGSHLQGTKGLLLCLACFPPVRNRLDTNLLGWTAGSAEDWANTLLKPVIDAPIAATRGSETGGSRRRPLLGNSSRCFNCEGRDRRILKIFRGFSENADTNSTIAVTPVMPSR
jgi:hypothetical protein